METRFPSRAVGSMTAVGCILFTMALNIAEVNRVQINLAFGPSVARCLAAGRRFRVQGLRNQGKITSRFSNPSPYPLPTGARVQGEVIFP